MLQSLVAYARGAGVDARWSVIDGEPDFFVLTKRIHHKLHGSPGDGGPLGPGRARGLRARHAAPTPSGSTEELHDGDIVLLHDPQTAGMAPALRRARRARRVALAHRHRRRPTSTCATPGSSCCPTSATCEAFIFTRREYAPPELQRSRPHDHPAVDRRLRARRTRRWPTSSVVSILATSGVVDAPVDRRARATSHHDGRADRRRAAGADGRGRAARRSTTASSSRSRAGTRSRIPSA